LFPFRLQGVATTIAGVLAVLAPTVGPIGGGWITQSFSWHWLFLINVLPGLVAASGAIVLLPRERMDPTVGRSFDLVTLSMMAVALAALEIGLKEAPGHGWASPLVIGLMCLSLVASFGFVRRSLAGGKTVVDLTALSDANFAIGCGLSFVMGIGLFGSVYLMPVFLGLVRGHDALQIGEIMLLTGVAQLVCAPIAVALERRVDVRVLTAFGFLLFGTGLGLSAMQTEETDFAQMVWPQILRGSAIMFCLLPPTRLALGHLETARVANASGLFNLMRNLGGAIGLALIDTVIYGRAPIHASAIVARLKAGDIETARQIGIPVAIFRAHAHAPLDARTAEMLQPMVQKLSLVQAINDAWGLVAILTLFALAALPFAKPQPLDTEGDPAVLLGLVE
jgi:DHA2 family multidrug resistance protein